MGDRDPIVAANREFEKLAEARDLPVTLEIKPGVHDWNFWVDALPDHVAFASEQLKSSGEE